MSTFADVNDGSEWEVALQNISSAAENKYGFIMLLFLILTININTLLQIT
jgi:hypothetical protein